MITLFRFYLYWSVLWGFMVHPSIGLKRLASPLLLGMDLLIMGVCTVYIVIHAFDRDKSPIGRQIQLSAVACAFLLTYGIAITTIMGGSTFDAGIYIAVLLRPMLILITLAVHLRISPHRSGNALYKTLRIDLIILVGIQLAIATLQKINPDLGAQFIASFDVKQSAIYALAEGDVSGTFANSIDLAYFLLAAYIVLTQRCWQFSHAPPLILTGIFIFYVNATGSMAATICLMVHVCYLWLRSQTIAKRGLAVFSISLIIGAFTYINLSTISLTLIDKVDNMMLSRLGLILTSIPALFSSLPHRLLTGTGADFNIILALINNLPDVPLAFIYEGSATMINDVFWVALLLSFGAPATFIFIYRMAQIFKTYITRSYGTKQTQNLVWIIWFIVFLAGLFNQILLVRPFTLALTLGLLPLAMGSFHTRANRSVSDNRFSQRI